MQDGGVVPKFQAPESGEVSDLLESLSDYTLPSAIESTASGIPEPEGYAGIDFESLDSLLSENAGVQGFIQNIPTDNLDLSNRPLSQEEWMANNPKPNVPSPMYVPSLLFQGEKKLLHPSQERYDNYNAKVQSYNESAEEYLSSIEEHNKKIDNARLKFKEFDAEVTPVLTKIFRTATAESIEETFNNAKKGEKLDLSRLKTNDIGLEFKPRDMEATKYARFQLEDFWEGNPEEFVSMVDGLTLSQGEVLAEGIQKRIQVLESEIESLKQNKPEESRGTEQSFAEKDYDQKLFILSQELNREKKLLISGGKLSEKYIEKYRSTQARKWLDAYVKENVALSEEEWNNSRLLPEDIDDVYSVGMGISPESINAIFGTYDDYLGELEEQIYGDLMFSKEAYEFTSAVGMEGMKLWLAGGAELGASRNSRFFDMELNWRVGVNQMGKTIDAASAYTTEALSLGVPNIGTAGGGALQMATGFYRFSRGEESDLTPAIREELFKADEERNARIAELRSRLTKYAVNKKQLDWLGPNALYNDSDATEEYASIYNDAKSDLAFKEGPLRAIESMPLSYTAMGIGLLTTPFTGGSGLIASLTTGGLIAVGVTSRTFYDSYSNPLFYTQKDSEGNFILDENGEQIIDWGRPNISETERHGYATWYGIAEGGGEFLGMMATMGIGRLVARPGSLSPWNIFKDPPKLVTRIPKGQPGAGRFVKPYAEFGAKYSKGRKAADFGMGLVGGFSLGATNEYIAEGWTGTGQLFADSRYSGVKYTEAQYIERFHQDGKIGAWASLIPSGGAVVATHARARFESIYRPETFNAKAAASYYHQLTNSGFFMNGLDKAKLTELREQLQIIAKETVSGKGLSARGLTRDTNTAQGLTTLQTDAIDKINELIAGLDYSKNRNIKALEKLAADGDYDILAQMIMMDNDMLFLEAMSTEFSKTADGLWKNQSGDLVADPSGLEMFNMNTELSEEKRNEYKKRLKTLKRAAETYHNMAMMGWFFSRDYVAPKREPKVSNWKENSVENDYQELESNEEGELNASAPTSGIEGKLAGWAAAAKGKAKIIAHKTLASLKGATGNDKDYALYMEASAEQKENGVKDELHIFIGEGTNEADIIRDVTHEFGHFAFEDILKDDATRERIASEIYDLADKNEVLRRLVDEIRDEYPDYDKGKLEREVINGFMVTMAQGGFRTRGEFIELKLSDMTMGFENWGMNILDKFKSINGNVELGNADTAIRLATKFAKFAKSQGVVAGRGVDDVIIEETVKAGGQKFSEPVEDVIEISRKYKESVGLDPSPVQPITELNIGNSKEIADAYEALENNPNDPEVKEAYEVLGKEIIGQYKSMMDAGYVVEIWEGEGQPYKNSKEMLQDVRDNKHMWIFSTEVGYGEGGISEKDRAENPMLRDTEFKDANGKPLLVNDLFRAIHDFYGHSELGNSFGPVGEENAWNVHSRMFSPLARRAMTTETRGQNSWVNFGPQMRTEKGEIIKKGEEGYLKPQDREYAPQKLGLLPKKYSQLPEKVLEVAKEQFTAHNENGGSTFLNGVDQEGRPVSSVSIFPERSKLIEGKEVTKEVLDKYMQDNKDLLKGNEDILAIGTWYDSKTNQTYLDISVTVGHKEAIDLGRQYNQKSVFNLETYEEVDTGGTGEAIEGLKPEIDRIGDIRSTLKPSEGLASRRIDVKTQAMTAPNGKPSNLTAEQHDLVRTPAFKKWFGDSKVVDENGEPLVVYHGSMSGDIDVFDNKSKNFNTVDDVEGFYFTVNKQEAAGYAKENPFISGEFNSKASREKGKVYPAFLKITDPLNITEDFTDREAQPKGKRKSFKDTKRNSLKRLSKSNDGVVFEGDRMNSAEYVTFKPNQIKLADGTNITFDPASPSILASRRIGVKKPIDVESFEEKAERLNEEIQEYGQPWQLLPKDSPSYETQIPDLRLATPEELEYAADRMERLKAGESLDDVLPGKLLGDNLLDDILSEPTSLGGRRLAGRKHVKGSRAWVESTATPFGAKHQWITRVLQDKFSDILLLQQDIEVFRGKKVPQSQDFGMHEETMYGELRTDLERLDKEMVKIRVAMKDANLTAEQVSDYLYAKHAPERNEYINSKRPEMLSGSGMTTQEAEEIINELETPEMIAVSKLVYDIVSNTRKTMREGGLEKASTIETWESLFKYYVPLSGIAEDEKGDEGKVKQVIPKGGAGMGVYGKTTKAAKGRPSKTGINLIANVITQNSMVKQRARKDLAMLSLYNLVKNNPNEEVWGVYSSKNPKMQVDETGKMVGMNIFEMKASPNMVPLRINGEQHFIHFKSEEHANALNGMTTEKVNAVIKTFSPLMNFMRNSFTQYNPSFFLGNYFRDLHGAMYAALAEVEREGGIMQGYNINSKKFTKDVIVGSVVSLRALLNESAFGREMSAEMVEWVEEWKAAGGRTGFSYMESISNVMETMRTSMETNVKLKWGQTELFDTGISKESFASKEAQRLFDSPKTFFKYVAAQNEAFENSIRLSAYIEARKAGVTKRRAAQLSKNITINFNKSGEQGATLNSIFLFFNASVQGLSRFTRTFQQGKAKKDLWKEIKGELKDNPDELITWSRRISTAQKLAAGSVLFSAMQTMINMAISDRDEDDGELVYNKYADYKKERGFQIMYDGKNSFFGPLGYGYNMMNIAGVMLAEVAAGQRSVYDAAMFMAIAGHGSFSPIAFGHSETVGGSIVKGFTPSVGKAWLDAFAFNETYFGGIVQKKQYPWGAPAPESQLSFRSPELVKQAATALHEMSNPITGQPGGTDYISGPFEINPDPWYYIMQSYWGGGGDFVEETAGMGRAGFEVARRKYNKLAASANSDEFIDNLLSTPKEDIPIIKFSDVPILKVIYGGPSRFYDFDLFEENRKDIEQKAKELNKNTGQDVSHINFTGVEDLEKLLKGADEALRDVWVARRAAKDIEDYIDRSHAAYLQQENERKIVMRFNALYYQLRGQYVDPKPQGIIPLNDIRKAIGTDE